MMLPRTASVLILGILATRMAIFMSLPFLAIYLESLQFDSMQIGVILAAHYFTAGMFGIFGGNIADQWGFKRTILATLITGALSFFALGSVSHFWGFLLCNVTLAILTATFEPVATSLTMGVISPDLHAIAYRYRYMAINIGASLGPLVGVLLASYKPELAFWITGTCLLVYALIFSCMKNFAKSPTTPFSLDKLKSALHHMRKDKPFLFLLAANFFMYMSFCQIFSTLPQILNKHLESGLYLYSILLTVNPITVILVGLVFTQILSRQSQSLLLKTGSILLAFSFLGFHLLPLTYMNTIVLMIIFTIAEIIVLPTSAKFLIDIAPMEHRGTYLGSESCSYLGFFAGNLMGGFLLQTVGGVFLFCFFCAMLALLFYSLACTTQQQQTNGFL